LAATTVRVDEAPAATVEGLAERVTVVAAGALTVTVAEAVAGVVPAPPVAVAVYVVVADGVTVCDPPVPGMEYLLPSEPVITTADALCAETFRTEDVPDATEPGVAASATVGAAAPAPTTVVPQPARNRIRGRKQVSRAAENIRERDLVGPRTFTCMSPDTFTDFKPVVLASVVGCQRKQRLLLKSYRKSWIKRQEDASLRDPLGAANNEFRFCAFQCSSLRRAHLERQRVDENRLPAQCRQRDGPLQCCAAFPADAAPCFRSGRLGPARSCRSVRGGDRCGSGPEWRA